MSYTNPQRVAVGYTDRTLREIPRILFAGLQQIEVGRPVQTLPAVYWRVIEWRYDTPSAAREAASTWIVIEAIDGHDLDPRDDLIVMPPPDEWRPIVPAGTIAVTAAVERALA